MKSACVFVLMVVLAVLALPGLSQTPPVHARVSVTNTCAKELHLTHMLWFEGALPIKVEVLRITVPLNQTYHHVTELSVHPGAVVVRGIADGKSFEVRVPMGETVKFPCGAISAHVEKPPPPPVKPPSGPEPVFPPGMPKVPLRPGMSPDEIVRILRAAGAHEEIQGSEDKPKLTDAADPILVGALPGGFAFLGLWVSTTGSLRVAATYDRPAAFVWVWVVPVPNLWDMAMAWSPVPGGGISVSVDRPAIYQPLTQWGNAPVPGTLFLVLVIKWEMVPLPFPFVLSLSN